MDDQEGEISMKTLLRVVEKLEIILSCYHDKTITQLIEEFDEICSSGNMANYPAEWQFSHGISVLMRRYPPIL